jgi:hypothetical protein
VLYQDLRNAPFVPRYRSTNASRRTLAIVETVIGQLYLAILIGRLVGAYTAELRGGGE